MTLLRLNHRSYSSNAVTATIAAGPESYSHDITDAREQLLDYSQFLISFGIAGAALAVIKDL